MKAIFAYAAMLVCVIVLVFPLGISNVAASPRTITVPDDYSSISSALENASEGDVVFVKSGVYYENPQITKSVSLVAEDNESTIVVGTGGEERGARAVFTILASNVEISNFEITSLNYSSNTMYATGILVGGDSCVITENNIYNTYYGIFASVQSNTIISRNNIKATLKDGIRFCGGSLNVISENNIVENRQSGIAIEGYLNKISRNNIDGNGRGIGLGSSYSLVFGNNITEHVGSGVFMAGSNNVVSANHLSSCDYGVYFTFNFASPSNNRFYRNNFIENEYNAYFSASPIENFWDNGYPIGGNYWDDYEGSDEKSGVEQNADGADEIFDESMTVSDLNVDGYPLVEPVEIFLESEPAMPDPPLFSSSGTVALWHFDEVGSDGVTPDAVGDNPAILGSTVENVSFAPVVTEGKVGNALSFSGMEYAYVPVSPSLDTREEVTIEAWIYVKEFKDVSYNVILVESARTAYRYPTRTLGLAVNGEEGGEVLQGALRGFVLDEAGVFNEIVTTESVISLNKWFNVMFTRSLGSGMHIYVDGAEQNVTVVSGVQDPSGLIAGACEIYMGHDSFTILDEVSVSNFALAPLVPLWMNLWFWAFAIAGVTLAISVVYLLRICRTKQG
jgi:hypothetical protein